MRVRRGLAGELDSVAFAEGALRASGVHYVEIVTGHEDVRLAVGERTLDAAGGGVRLATLGGRLGFGIFKGDLRPHFIGNELLHFRC